MYPDVYLPKNFKPNAPLDDNPYAVSYFTYIASEFPKKINNIKSINSRSREATRVRDAMKGQCAPSGELEFANEVLYSGDQFSNHSTLVEIIDEIAYNDDWGLSGQEVYQFALDHRPQLLRIIRRYIKKFEKANYHDTPILYTYEGDCMVARLKIAVRKLKPTPLISTDKEDLPF